MNRVPKVLSYHRFNFLNGKYFNWLEFRDTFQSLIHNNSQIGAIQKFHYLRASLESAAAEVMNSLEFSADNYTISWDLICSRYNNTKLLVHNHLKSLFDFPAMTRESCKELRQMLDTLLKHLRSLNNLKLDTTGWDVIIIYIMVGKLDKVSSRFWEEVKLSGDPTLNEFKEFLRNRADLLETIELNQGSKTLKQIKDYLPLKSQKHTKSFVSTTVSKCSLCSDSHHMRNCDRFLKLPIKQRVDEVKKLQLCINCLNSKHISRNCSASLCRKCRGRHHTLLHFETSKRTDPTSDLTTKHELEKPPNVESTLTLSSYQPQIQSGEVLLSTALVQVFDSKGISHNCRLLLDSGSQSNFISSDTCKRLGLCTSNTSLTVVGINQVANKLSSRSSVKIKSNTCAFTITLNCFVIPTISAFVPSTPIDVSELNIPKNIRLADPHFHIPGVVDILIGAGVFWELLCVGQLRLGDCLPILQKTKLGWVVAGPCAKVPFSDTTQ